MLHLSHAHFRWPQLRRWLWLCALAALVTASGCAVNPVPTPSTALDNKGIDAGAGGAGSDQADTAAPAQDAAFLSGDATATESDAGASDAGNCSGDAESADDAGAVPDACSP